MTSAQAENLERSLIWSILVLCVVHSLWAAYSSWYLPITDEHSFRQTQTAITSYYLLRGGPLWKYETPVLGPPWSIPYEFPLYQWLVAVVVKFTAIPLEQAGRLVARFFFYLALWPLFRLLRAFDLKPIHIVPVLCLYLASPLYLFWSRTFMIESTALYFSLAYVALTAEVLRKGKKTTFLVHLSLALSGALAGAVKVTTFFGFIVAAGCMFVHKNWREHRWDWRGWVTRGNMLFAISSAAIPILLTILWIHFADAQKVLNPLAAEYITSKALQGWNFGSAGQRLDPRFWDMLFNRAIPESVGHQVTWILSIILLWFVPARLRWLYAGALALFLLVPLTFANLHIVHNYYTNANAIFLLLALGICIAGALQETGWRKAGGVIFLGLAVFLSLRQYHYTYYNRQFRNDPTSREIGELAKRYTAPGDVLLVHGVCNHPIFAYYAERRAIIDPVILGPENCPLETRSLDSREMRASLALLRAEGREVGAMLVCGSKVGNRNLIAEAHRHLSIGLTPVAIRTCTLWECFQYPANTPRRSFDGANCEIYVRDPG